MRSLVLAMASMAYLSGCFGSPTDFQKQATSGRSGAVGTLATKTKDGVTSATIRADQDSEQILELNDIPELKGSSLSLPPGSLAIAVNVNVQEAAPLATTPNALDLNLGTGFTKAGVPIVIQADKNIDLLKPMTISLPLPSSGQLMLADPFENLVVLYKVTVADSDKLKIGALLRSALTISGNNVVFTSSHMGAYQVAFTEKPVQVVQEVATQAPILTKKEEAKLLIVDVGYDKHISVGEITLDARTTSAVKFTWEKISGVGDVTFGSANAEDTKVSFTKDGIYVLRLTVQNEKGESASDDITINYDPWTTAILTVTLVNAAADALIEASEAASTDPLLSISSPSAAQISYSQPLPESQLCDANVSYTATVPTAASMSTDGSFIFCVALQNFSGKTYYVKSPVVVHAAAPTATISGAPTGTNNTVMTNITVAGTDVATYQYAIVPASTTCAAATYSADFSVATKLRGGLSGLTDGDLRLCVKGKSAAGFLQEIATEATWTKDTTAPMATVTGAPSGPNNVVVMDVTVVGAEVVTYQYDIVPAATYCASATYSTDIAVGTKITEDISALPDGDIRLCVKGKDAAGNLQATATETTWTKDTTAPAAAISGAPSGTNNIVVMDITIAGTGVGNYQYDIVPAATPCTAATYSSYIAVGTKITEDISGMADGLLRLCVKGKDAAGNLQAAASEVTWTKNTAAPTASITGAPSGTNNTVAMDITIGGADVVTYQYDIVPSATPCSAAAYSSDIAVGTKITESISGMADGALRLCVKGKDAMGNLQATATEVTWTKDTTAPLATISGAPSGTNNFVVMDITIGGVGVLTYQYAIVPIATTCAVATYSSETTVATKISDDISGLSDGDIRLCVKGKDSAGNLQASATESTWTKDGNAIAATISGAPTGANNTTVMNVSIGGTGVVNYQYDIVSSALDCMAATYSTDIPVGTLITENISGLADGDVRLCVKGKNALGDLQPVATEVTWTKDTTSPVIDVGPDQLITTSTNIVPMVVGATVYQWSKVSCSPDVVVTFGSATAQNTSISFASDAMCFIRLTAMDAAGNSASDDLSITWDSTAPTATITGAPSGTNAIAMTDITIGGADVVLYTYALVAAVTPCSSASYSSYIPVATKINDNLSAFADGELRLCVKGKDSVGNLQEVASETSWTKSEGEINVKFGATDILSGIDTHTFASTIVGDASANATFTIQNTGVKPLSILSKLTITGAHPDEFEIVSQAGSMSIAPSTSTTFQVRFRPLYASTRTATLTISNSDADEGNFTFNLTGDGAPMAIGRSQYVDIDNMAGAALTDYPVLVKLDTKRYIDNGWMYPDCRDLRFGNQNRTDAYPYWIEEGTCGLDETRVWVRVPSIAAASITTIYAHFNAATTAGSNGYRVFPIFDDFEDGVVDSDKWTTVGGAVESGGKIRFSVASAAGLISKEALLPGYWAMEAELYVNSVGSGAATGFRMGQNSGSNGDYVDWHAEGGSDLKLMRNGDVTVDGGGTKGMVVGPHKITVKQQASGISFAAEGASNLSASAAGSPNLSAAPIQLGEVSGSTGYNIDVKYFAARPLANPEPTTSFLNRIIPVAATISNLASGTSADISDYKDYTKWVSFNAPQYFEVDLGKRYTVDKIRLNVAQSPNGSTIHEVYAGPNPNPATLIHTFNQSTSSDQWLVFDPAGPLANVRYVRIQTTSSPSWFGWGEIEIYGKEQQTMFVTAATTNGNIGGLSGGDAMCQTEASAAGLQGTFKGVLSMTGVYARDRLKIRNQVHNTNGDLLGTNYSSLWSGGILTSVGYDAIGVASSNGVWTGSIESGLQSSSSCVDWTSSSGGDFGTDGLASSASGSWIYNSVNASCAEYKSIYCMNETSATKLTIKGGTASSEYHTNTALKAIDGDPYTYWTTGNYNGWLEVDLGRNVDISKVRFHMYLSTSGNATVILYGGAAPSPSSVLHTWNNAPLATENWYEIPVNVATSVRYVRISIDTSGFSWPALYELEVYK